MAVNRFFSVRSRVLYPITVKTTAGTKWGYINSNGTVAIRPQYEYANPFQLIGYAVVQLNGKQGLIDSSGAYVAQPVYDYIGSFSEGRVPVIKGSNYRLMNESGELVGEQSFTYMAGMHDGRAVVSATQDGGDSKYGYIDRQGAVAIPLQYEDAGDFSHGRALVKVKDHEFALILPNGVKLATYNYAFVGQPGDGYLPFRQTENGKTGYINELGAVVIPPRYAMALPFESGRAIINMSEGVDNQYGVIDRQGNTVIKPIYNDIQQLGNERFAVGKARNTKQPYIGSIYALFDNAGKQLTDFIFTEIDSYKHGVASASDGKTTFFIDGSGRAAQDFPVFNGSGNLVLMDDGIIQVNIDQRTLYALRNGRIVWQPPTTIPLRTPYRVKEEKYKPNRDYLVYYPVLEGMGDEAAEKRVNKKLRELSQVKPIDPEAQLDYSYTGDFDVAWFHKSLLVLELTGYNYPFGAAHGMPSQIYSHINVTNGQFYELKDLFKPGSDYVKTLSRIVGEQIKNDPQYDYVFPGSYKGIKPDQPFYVTENALKLYFQPYDIAPYAAGFPTFTIPYTQIESLINRQGDFWRSFHG
ncbi:WG repeat-containing protein [Paenibacillus sp. NPDC058174]|uniref:WG repeat-containing protein n=1 Tax=Paenibacillus sp. NPDC058174 TaxID=3346366 RepID=UPI0036DA6228